MSDTPVESAAPLRKPSLLDKVGLTLIVNLTLRDIRSQYNRTALGRIWSLVNPLAQIAIFSIIFGLVMRGIVPVGSNSGLDSFALWVATGIIPWGFISNGISTAMSSLMDNAGLLTKVYFPRHALTTSTVLHLAVQFLTELGVLSIIMAIFGGPKVFLGVPALLLVVLLNVVFVLGIGLALAVTMVYFRDLKHIWSIFTQLWFYASGIVFSLELVRLAQASIAARGWTIFGQPIPLVPLFEANPAFQFIAAYRSILFDFATPSPGNWFAMTLWAGIAITLGAAIFNRFQSRIVEEL